MSDDTYKSGREMGELTGEVKLLTSAVGNLAREFSDFKNGIGPRLETHSKELSTLDANRKNDLSYIDAINKKVDYHIDGHWKWVAILIGLITIFTLVSKMIK